ncbi:MAG: tRNA preQ1(34) S-adenosylmethionine ribosyltransferase-isomerase QueA [Chitinivibrionales bacterium]|nr:tRNA preQ1(34) S-adenosylmethionine ribosyltransferase-isomerase QueA [Chitinivibrionales bacterium]
MKTSDFQYDLPPELIAKYPEPERDQSRLLHLQRDNNSLTHHHFFDLPTLLKPGDRLVFNDTKVIPARLFCKKETGAIIELLFTEKVTDTQWKALARPLKRLRERLILTVDGNGSIHVKVDAILNEGIVLVSLLENNTYATISALLEAFGQMPLPPYIGRPASAHDRQVYQTVYAKHDGAIAAPTAGLHFTPELLEKLKNRGVEFSYITLHVGIGTFRPIITENPADHVMHAEQYHVSREAAEQINATCAQGGRIIAVGTTVVRVLEHCAMQAGLIKENSGSTDIFILPGFKLSIVNAMITNFHLPASTLLMLVSAFAGRETILAAYQAAIGERYRFYSYGDAMLIE